MDKIDGHQIRKLVQAEFRKVKTSTLKGTDEFKEVKKDLIKAGCTLSDDAIFYELLRRRVCDRLEIE